MTTTLQEAERARESQFAILKDTIKKLLYALDSRNQGTAQQQSLLQIILQSQSALMERMDSDQTSSIIIPSKTTVPISEKQADFAIKRITSVQRIHNNEEQRVPTAVVMSGESAP